MAFASVVCPGNQVPIVLLLFQLGLVPDGGVLLFPCAPVVKNVLHVGVKFRFSPVGFVLVCHLFQELERLYI